MTVNDQDYKEEKVTFLVDYLKTNERDVDAYDYQLDSNFAFIYILENQEIVVLPGNLSSYENGLILKNKEVLDKMIQEDYFPVTVKDYYYYEIYKDRFKNELSFNINNSISFLESKLKMKLTDTNYDDKFFDQFNNSIKNSDFSKHKDEYLFSLSFLLGEIIIKNKNGFWQINKEYGVYNPYYVPIVVLKNTNVELPVMERIMDELEKPKKFDLKRSYDLLVNPMMNPDLNPDAQQIYMNYIKKD